jgi:corrinoid protein of di/trimethylamine methyltransferase
MHTELFQQQMQAVVDGDSERAVALAREAIRSGADLSRCVDEGYVVGIREVGRLWAEGEYFLPELIQGADAMRAAMNLIRPEFLKGAIAREDPIKVVIGTVQGDIHEIGKSLVGTVLEANGFRVIDLGSDVPDATFLEAAEGEGARVVGMSALLTTTMPVQRRVIEHFEQKGVRERYSILVGGAPVTAKYANDIGADGFAANAVEALSQVHKLIRKTAP